jgi:hypothetical protein
LLVRRDNNGRTSKTNEKEVNVTVGFGQVNSSWHYKPGNSNWQALCTVTPAHALGAFCGSVSTKSELKKSEGYFFKEAQAVPPLRDCMSEAQRLER